MLGSDKVFAGSVPESYDRHMVPLIFESYAADIARRAASLSPGAVLEIAAGTGVVTRALAPKLSTTARYVVTDLNRPMLDYAASRQGPDSRIEWRQADALALPFENALGIRPVWMLSMPNIAAWNSRWFECARTSFSYGSRTRFERESEVGELICDLYGG